MQSHQQRKYNSLKLRSNRIFKRMALFVQSRDGIQCRSHHMKQLRTHKQVRKIILHYEQKIGGKVYETCN